MWDIWSTGLRINYQPPLCHVVTPGKMLMSDIDWNWHCYNIADYIFSKGSCLVNLCSMMISFDTPVKRVDFYQNWTYYVILMLSFSWSLFSVWMRKGIIWCLLSVSVSKITQKTTKFSTITHVAVFSRNALYKSTFFYFTRGRGNFYGIRMLIICHSESFDIKSTSLNVKVQIILWYSRL